MVPELCSRPSASVCSAWLHLSQWDMWPIVGEAPGKMNTEKKCSITTSSDRAGAITGALTLFLTAAGRFLFL